MLERRAMAFGLALCVVAAVVWLLQEGTVPEPASTPPANDAPTTTTLVPATGTVPADANPRTAAVDTTPPPAEPGNARTRGLQLRVRLRGLHPNAKWMAPLHLDLDGRDATTRQSFDDDSAAVPDAEGLAVFVVPDWVASATEQDGRLFAHDANYQPVDRRWDGAPDLGAELVIDVQVVANLNGRVVDTNGQPVPAARVIAFALHDGVPLDQELARTNTDDQGTWSSAVPTNVPSFLVALPMQSSGQRLRSFNGPLFDTGEWRDDLLPASARAQGSVGAPTAVPDLVLPAATTLHGRVRWRDGHGVAGAVVQVLPRGGVVLGLGESVARRGYAWLVADRTFVELATDGTLLPGARATTDATGAFTLPTRAGAIVDVRLGHIRDAHLLGAPMVTTTSPQPVEIVLPRPIRLQARHAGVVVGNATLELADGNSLTTEAEGSAEVVTTAPLRVRAAHGALRSAWLDVPATAAGTTVTLELLPARVPLTIEFDGEFRVRNTVVHWRRDDGEQGSEHLNRDDRAGPLELFLEPGRYHITAGPGGGERNGVFLLPVERDVDLTGAPVALRLPATFGGSFTVTATDSSGLHLGGICRVRDASGGDCSDVFEVQDDGQHRQGKPAELLPGAVNHFRRILPPGDYVLELEFERHGAVPQRVTIKPREVTDVRVRLP